MARRKGAPTGRCQGCNHPERVRIERFLAAGASIKGAARKFDIDYHALRRHWRNHVSAEARSAMWRAWEATKDQLEEFRCRRVSGVDRPISDCSRSTVLRVYRAAEMGDGNSVPATADQSLLPTVDSSSTIFYGEVRRGSWRDS
jgi:transposase-like protein